MPAAVPLPTDLAWNAAPDATLCRHCGDPCAVNATRTADGAFCCGGCASVFQVLREHGLDGFYACSVTPGISQRAATVRQRDRFAALDDPTIAASFLVSTGRQTARAVLPVPSLHCASCVWLVEQLWRLMPGVTHSEVDLMRRVVRIDFDPGATTVRRVAEALASIGYEPSLDDQHPHRVSPARRALLLKIGVAGFAFGNVMLFSIPQYANGVPLEPAFQRLFDSLNFALALPVLLYSASDYFRAAWGAIRQRVLTLDIPVALGLAVMFARSSGDILAGVGPGFFDSFSGLVLFLLVGKLFQQKAFDAIAFDRNVRSFLPLSIQVERDGRLVTVPVPALRAGDVMLVRPREVVPADAVLLDDEGAIDYAFVSGEQVPVPARRHDIVRAGGRVVDRALRLRAVRSASHGTLAELWSHPVLARVKRRWLTDVSQIFGAWFTFFALAVAAAGAAAWWPDARMSLQVATAVLIIACPCALTLAAPITLGTAMGVLGRAGCFLKTPAIALDLSRIDTIVFDKTGTLTTGGAEIAPQQHGLDDADWRLARALAGASAHPVSRALAAGTVVSSVADGLVATDVREFAGLGVTGTIDGHRVGIGNAAFVGAVSGRELAGDAALTWLSVDDRVGHVHLSAAARPGMDAMLGRLDEDHRLILLSGDHARDADTWRRWFGDRMHFRHAPVEKLSAIRSEAEAGRHVLMVGDGLNDAGAFAAADVGMAVSDDTACFVPACDVVIRGDRLAMLPALLAYALRARRVIVLSFLVSIAYNVLGLTLALRGDLTPLATAVLMPVSSLTVIALSVGLMRWRAPREVAA